MSSPSRWQRGSRFWFAPVLAIMVACSGLAVAAAVSVGDLANPKLIPSSAAPLLGPISQAGRKGWECTPERAAAAKGSSEAELPAAGPSP